MKEKITGLYEKYKELVNYLIFGVLSMVVNFGLYYVLTRVLSLEEVLSSGISWFITVLFVYITNKLFVFEKTKKNIFVEIISFYLARIATGFICDICIFTLLFKVLNLNDFISKIVVQVVVVILNYIFSKFIVFKNRDSSKKNSKKGEVSMKKKLVIIIPYIIIVTLLIMLFSYKFENSENGYIKYDTLENNKSEVSVEKIHDKDVIVQDYNVEKDNLKYIYIYFNKETTTNDGKYLIELINKNGDIGFSKEVDCLEIISAEGVYKAKLKNVEKGEYYLKFTYSGNETECSPLVNKIYKDNLYTINGQSNSGLIQTKSLYLNKIRTIIYYVLMIIFIAVCTIILYIVLVNKKDEKLEKKFLYIAIPIYLLYMIFVPLYVAHDELFHWYRVFEITEGGLLPDIQDNSTGYMVPSAIGSGLPWGDLKYIDIIKESFDTIDYNDKSFISDVTMSVYSPVQYLPQVIGVTLVKSICKSPIIISYYGRLFNLIFCIVLLYFAIKTIPYGKRLVFAISFIPIAIEGFISLSGDGFTLSAAMLFISYILEIYNSKRVLRKRDFVLLGVLGTIIAFCKIVYIPIVFLLLLIPKESFGTNKKKYFIIIPMIIFFVFCNLLWLALANPYLNVYTNGKSGYQIKYVLTNPIKYCQNFLYTIQTNGIGYIMEMFGKNMLWANAVKNETFVPMILIALVIFICLKDDLKKRFDLKSVIIITCIILCVIALMFTSLYVQWTRYASTIIDGVQGRYFLPIIILAFLLLGNFIGRDTKDIKEAKNNLDTVLVISCVFVSLLCLMEMITKYI